jgi:Uma2 family endonuclease
MAGERGDERRRWTREEYYRLGDLEIFGDVRVELLDGFIWEVPPLTPPHAIVILMAPDWSGSACRGAYSVRQHGPLVLTDYSEPEPDILVVSGSWRDYMAHHPTAAEACLLVEVADTNLAKNRDVKAELYAASGIIDYWIINLVDRQLEVYRDPAALPNSNLYKSRQVLAAGDVVTPLFAPDSSIAVADLLPPFLVQQP